MSNINTILALNKHAFKSTGELKTPIEQYAEWAFAKENLGIRIQINSIKSMHSKIALLEHIQTAIEKKREIFVNERTGAWLKDSKEWEPINKDRISLTKVLRQTLSSLYCNKYPEQARRIGMTSHEGVEAYPYPISPPNKVCQLGQEIAQIE